MSNKKIQEMNSVAAVQAPSGGFKRRYNREAKHKGQPFSIAPIAVYEKGRGKNQKKSPYKLAYGESKSESMLREAIRNLVFLNRVKYHEENAKREMQEQKLRKIIRHLLKEGDDALEGALDTTGQTAAFKFLQKVETTTFKNFYSNLKTSRKQRREFKKMYLTGIKVYLDALDQQYYILNPQAKMGGPAPDMPTGAPVAPAAVPGMAPSAPLAEATEPVDPAASGVADSIKSDTGHMQKHAISAAISPSVAASDDETIKSAIDNAKDALKADLAQIDNLYFSLSFKEFTTGTGRTTSDRKDFRLFLIGDEGTVGNLQVKFKQYNLANPIKNNIPDDIPDEDVEEATPVLDVPKSSDAGNVPPPDAGALPPEAPPAASTPGEIPPAPEENVPPKV